MLQSGQPMIGGAKKKDFFFESEKSSKKFNDLNKSSLKYKSKQTGGLRIIPQYIEPYSNPYQPINESQNKSKQYFEDKKDMKEIRMPIAYAIPPDPNPLNGKTQAYIPPVQNQVPIQQNQEPRQNQAPRQEYGPKKEYGPKQDFGPKQESVQSSLLPRQNYANVAPNAYITQNPNGTGIQLNMSQPIPMGPPPKAPQNTFNPTYYVPMMNPYPSNTVGNPLLWHPAVPPIVQKYNITFGGQDIRRLGEVYEEMLPQQISVAKNTFNSLSERLLVLNYLRSVLVKNGDGEEVGFDSKRKPEINALLSHLKIIGVNPYNYNKMTNNPYTGLPDRLIIYKSCYPIKVDVNSQVKCANDNIGINVRIYQLLEGEIAINMIGESIRKYFEVWREMAYYEYIRENIIKSNKSPNFVSLISYFSHPRSLIDFVKYRQEKGTTITPGMNKYNKLFNQYVNSIMLKTPGIEEKIKARLEEKYAAYKHKMNFNLSNNPYNSLNNFMFNTAIKPVNPKTPINNWNDFIGEKMKKENIYMDYSDMCLVALTEAPTQDILRWRTRIYEQSGINTAIYRAVSTGYHDPEVWKSVLFQLHQALFILDHEDICIWDFSLENNVFIKETNYDNNNIGYWKYIINGIEFYIPNYGAILLIDTNFKDLDVNEGDQILSSLLSAPTLDDKCFIYKIMMGGIFDKDQTQRIKDRNKENFKKAFDSGSFSNKTDKTSVAIPPDSNILSLINGIKARDNYIKNIIINHGHFLHNRVGTILSKTEKTDTIANTDFKPGELIGYAEGNDHYVGVIFEIDQTDPATRNPPSPSKAKVIKVTIGKNKEKTTMIEDVEYGNIIRLNEKLKQIYKPNVKLADEDLIETYEINF